VSCWTDPTWLAEAHEWIHAQLARLDTRAVGEIEQRSVQPWSTVLRVPTDLGDVYFKANGTVQRHEVALVTLLAERRPDCIPAPLAGDLERGWMLMGDAGIQLRELIGMEQEMTRWLDVLPLYAGVQIDLAADAEELIALGTPDLRLATLPARYEQLLDQLEGLPPHELARCRGSVPRVADMCRELAGYGLPDTIQHDDLDDEQIFVRDGRYLLLDWGDACVSHPFFSMSVTLEGVIAWGVDDVRGAVEIEPFRDAYLRPFAQDLSEVDLAAACSTALRLGWLCRAINAHRKHGHHRPSDPGQLRSQEAEHTRVRLRMFLDGQP
jgi:hypothetical protein